MTMRKTLLAIAMESGGLDVSNYASRDVELESKWSRTVEQLQTYAKGKPVVNIKLSELKHQYPHDRISKKRLDAVTIDGFPIIALRRSDGTLVTVDGFHRAYKAITQGHSSIKGVILSEADMGEASFELFSGLVEGYKNQFGEEKALAHARTANKHIYLFHGTRTSPDLIGRVGLSIKANGSNDARIKGNKIWFTPSKAYSGLYGIPLLVKLNTESLEFVERLPFQKTVNEYVYSSDIPASDIVFPGSPAYANIPKEHSYLHV